MHAPWMELIIRFSTAVVDIFPPNLWLTNSTARGKITTGRRAVRRPFVETERTSVRTSTKSNDPILTFELATVQTVLAHLWTCYLRLKRSMFKIAMHLCGSCAFNVRRARYLIGFRGS